MRIIIGELKKIWSLKIIIIIAVFCASYFVLFMFTPIDFYKQHRTSGGIGSIQTEFAHYLTERFGSTIEQEDLDEMLRYRDEIIASVLNRLPLSTGDSGNTMTFFDVEGNQIAPPTSQELAEAVFDGIVVMYNDRHDLIDRFVQSNIAYNTSLRELRINRLYQIRDNDAQRSILNPIIFVHILEYLQRLAVLAILATLVLVSQLVVTDRTNKVNWLQYTSRQGRSILKKQFVAIVISAIGITTLVVFIFMAILFYATNVHAFWNNGINGFMSFPYHWLSITFGQYCLLIIGIIYLLAIGAATLAFTLSRFSKNLVLLIFKTIPLFVFAILLSNWVLGDFLSLFDTVNIFIQLLVFAGLFAVGIGVAIFVIRKEKMVELL